MARALKARSLLALPPIVRAASTAFRSRTKRARKPYSKLTSDQALLFADTFDRLLADEEEEQVLTRSPPHQAPRGGPERLGTVKWYDAKKGFGFVTPNGGGQEVFLHRSVLEQAGMTDLAKGTRVCFHTLAGKRGPQVSMLALV